MTGSGGFVPVNLESPARFASGLSEYSPDHPHLDATSDVPQAVLARPTAEVLRQAALPPAQERAACRFAAWLADPLHRPAYRFAPRPGQPAEIAAALACPDLFLLDTPLGQERLDAIVALVEAARESGQRLAILTATSENANAIVLALPPEGLGRAKAEREGDLPPVVAEQTAHTLALGEWRRRRSALLSQQQDATRQLKWWSEWNRLADEEAALAAADGEPIPPDEAALAFTEMWQRSETEWANRVEARKIRDDADAAARRALVAEVEELRKSVIAPAGSGLGGFVKKLFGGVPTYPKIDAAEAKLRESDAAVAARNKPDDEADAELRTHRTKLLFEEGERVRAVRADRRTRLHRERDALSANPPPASRERLQATISEIETELADSEHPPAAPRRETIQKLSVVVGPLASLDSDPFFAPTHPETEPPFDRVLFADAEDLSPADFARAARLADAQTMLGSTNLPKPAYRNGKPGRGEFFRDTFDAVGASPWRFESGRTVAIIAKAEPRSLRAEPLADNPGIELRFFDLPDGRIELAEVAFGSGFAFAEIKRFLYGELGIAKAHLLGLPEWTENADAIRCTWPGPGADSEFELAPGIRESLVGGETIGFQFAGWTRPAAEEWFREHFGTHPATRAARMGNPRR